MLDVGDKQPRVELGPGRPVAGLNTACTYRSLPNVVKRPVEDAAGTVYHACNARRLPSISTHGVEDKVRVAGDVLFPSKDLNTKGITEKGLVKRQALVECCYLVR